MRIRSPAQFYIKSLIADPDGITTEALVDRLLDEGVDYISVDYLDRLRARMRIPTPFHPTNVRHTRSVDFLVQERLLKIFQPDAHMRVARALLEMPRAKEFIESMILIQVPYTATAAYVSRQFGVQCTARALELYAHYFWNTNLLDSSQMRLLIALRFEQAEETEKSPLKGKKKLLDRAYYKDPRKMAAEIPPTKTSAMLLQLRLGSAPPKQTVAAQLMSAQETLYSRLLEVLHEDSLAGSQKVANYANGARVLQELVEMVIKPEDQMKDQLRALTMRTNKTSMPSVHQLTQGNHTVEMVPLEAKKHDE